MSLKTSCPEQMQLRHFLLGQASTVEAVSVEEHLQYCAGCRAVVDGLRASDDSGMTLRVEADPSRDLSVRPPVQADQGDQTCQSVACQEQSIPAADPGETAVYQPAANVNETCTV